MLDINELINEVSKSTEKILNKELSGLKLKSKTENYKKIISEITFYTIETVDNPKILETKLASIKDEIFKEFTDNEKIKKISSLLLNAKIQHHFELFNKARKEKRENINKAIKEIIIPFLRDKGFKGTFPNFSKKDNLEIYKLRFLFSQFGPQFTVEIAKGSSENQISQISFFKSLRIGSIKNGGDYWYDYNNSNSTEDIYSFRANEVIENWPEAEKWWKEN